MPSMSYREAGVDLEAGTRAVELMKDAVRATYGPEVLLGIGAFGGLFDASALKGMDRPVLVASTDGVGTKTKIACRRTANCASGSCTPRPTAFPPSLPATPWS